MSNSSTTATVSEHTAYLRRLAFALLRDQGAVDDAVQETWLQAVRTPPDEGPTQRAWLAQVLRNVVRKGWRGDARRQRREASWVPASIVEEPGVQLQRTEQATILLAAIQQLSPPKREVVELRFFDNLPPRKIAARLGIPVETAKTRLKRALAELRASLQQQGGSRWASVLASAFGLKSAGASTAAGLSMTAVLLLALGVGVAVVGGYIAFDRLSGSDDALSSGNDSVLLKSAAEQETPAPVLVSRRRSPSNRPTTQPTTRSAKPDPKTRNERGTITVRDANGRAVDAPNGHLHITRWKRGGGGSEVVAVVDGVFATDVAIGSEPEFEAYAFEDRVAYISSPDGRTKVPDSGVFEMEAVVVPDTVLRVIDAETGAPVSDVLVLRIKDSLSAASHPAARVRESRSVGRSPASLRPTVKDVIRMQAEYHVGSPGYAWVEVEVKTRSGREHIVELPRAGAVELRVEGPRLDFPAHVRLRNKRGTYFHAQASFPLEPGQTIACDGLPTGAYLGRVEVGHYFGRPRVLGKVAFEIREGDTSVATLRYQSFEKPKAVPFAGEVYVPAGWPIEKLQLSVALRDPPLLGQSPTHPVFRPKRGLTPVPDTPGTWRFDAGMMQAGRYRLSFRPYEYAVFVTLDSEGMTDLRIDVPEPRTVRVVVEGDQGGSEPFLTSILWRRPTDETVNMWTSQTERRESATQPFAFIAAEGPLLIRAAGQAYQGEEQRIEVIDGANRITLRVAPTAQIVVRVMDGTKLLPQDGDWEYDCESLTTGAKVLSWGACDAGMCITVSGPGVYRLKMDKVPGFLPIPDQEIEVGEDRRGSAIVRLERR